MNIQKTGLFILLGLFLGSCGKSYKELKPGIDIKYYIKSASQRKAAPGMTIVFNLRTQLSMNSVLYNSAKNADPDMITFPADFNRYPILNALATLVEGDSVSLRISADSFYGKWSSQPKPKEAEKSESIYMEIKVLYLLNPNELEGWKNKRKLMSFEKEIKEMEAWGRKEKLNLTTLENGIKYCITKTTTGESIAQNDSVEYDCRASVMQSGFEFLNTSQRSIPMSYKVGTWMLEPTIVMNTIPTLLKDGESGVFIIPFDLGIKNSVYPEITPYSNLVYRIDNIKKINIKK